MAARAWMHGLAFTLFLTLGAEAESSTSPVANHCRTSDDNLRQAIIEVHDKQRNVGLAAVVMRNGALVFSVYLGLADLEHSVPVGAKTQFGIASITKLFTAVTLRRQHAAGSVDLDASVQQYVPAFPKKAESEITVRPSRYYSWPDLMRRVFLIDVLRCPRCKASPMRILAAIHPPTNTRAILESLDLLRI